jgi:hypothetical protein
VLKVRATFSIILLASLLYPWSMLAQDQILSVEIGDPVYPLLEILSVKGVLPPISEVRPYRGEDVRALLEAAVARRNGQLSERERSMLADMGRQFEKKPDSLARLAFEAKADFRSNFSDVHSVNALITEVTGSLGASLAYNMNLGVLLDKVDPESFPPFDFTKSWDGFHVWGENGQVLISDGINSHLNFSFNTHPELSLDLLGSRLNLQLSRQRREWGVGEGSLSLSGTARPMEALVGSVRYSSRWQFHFLTGMLGNWFDKAQEQKAFSIHRLEFFPARWLYLSAWESVVWAKRFELSYINPLMSYFMGQQINGDLDNIAFGADLAVTIAPWARLYFSIFIDELVLTPLDKFFTSVTNQYAWQAGLKVPLPGLPFFFLLFQYTKIEPYCYTHYLQSLPQYGSTKININYTHDGENIGYHLPPNSDEFLVRFFTYPRLGLGLAAQYRLIRHGTGSLSAHQIEGDIDTPIDYSLISSYPAKDFLHDGSYEWINVASLRAAYEFVRIPLSLWAEYALVFMDTSARSLIGLGGKWRFSLGRGGS